jgi:hypothetical protein
MTQTEAKIRLKGRQEKGRHENTERQPREDSKTGKIRLKGSQD